ncbi:glycosyltransferase family 4 protein [Endozoicomonas numazuensis]|uniref:Glycosyl transferase family 1 domain-containing protein n=1 Tax=Endozoicomonas numazuensis TaxID=1137799 RepID=A0A081N3R4_9GAMM|nr:glycosyltransferase family 4 protein [Endozoicomonas numazuensis]KEQ13087.1 hypothetical protein GZ78_26385 [Endozoicomonas numazuensis]
MASAKRKVLYVTGLWTGIKPFFLEGNPEPKGMPAFFNPLLMMANDDRFDVIDIFFFGSAVPSSFKLPDQYRSKINVRGFGYKGKLDFIAVATRLLHALLKVCSKEKVDVLYGHGPAGAMAGLTSLVKRVPNVRRIYGTFLIDEIKSAKLSLFFKHPLEYLAFSLPAKAVVITNDGTHGDKVYQKIGSKYSPLFFWLNGVEKINEGLPSAESIRKKFGLSGNPYACYVARFDHWKRQDIVVKAMLEVVDFNLELDMVLVGPVYNRKFYQELKEYTESHGLTERVHFIPGVEKKEALALIRDAKVSLSFYNISNLGNVFLETMVLNTPILAQNINGSLAAVPKAAYMEPSSVDAEGIAEALQKLTVDLTLVEQQVTAAKEFALSELSTWEERCERELELLL